MIGGGDHRRDYMDMRVTPHKRVTSPTLGPPPPCKQAQSSVDGNEKDKKVIVFYQQNKRLHVVEQKSKKSVNRLSLHRRCFSSSVQTSTNTRAN